MAYKAEQARLFSTADDVNYEVLQVYQVIYTLTHDILGVQGEVAEGERNVQVIQAQQQQGIAEPLNAIQKELNLIGKQDELQGTRTATPHRLRAPTESSRWRVEVDSMKQSQRIVKNSIIGIAAGVIGGLVYLATTVAIARNPHVSVAAFGEYQWVLAFAMIAQFVADSGLPQMMIREIAKDPECVGKIVGVAAALIWVISLVVCLLVGIVALFLPYHADVKIALLIMTFATLSTFHAAGYGAVLRAFEDNELNYLGFILQKILLFVFILIMLHFRTGLIGFVVAHLLSNVLLWNFYHIIVSRFYTKVKLQVDLPLWKELFLTALPTGGGVMLRQLALNIDIFILGIMTKNMTTVGLFGGPYRLSWSLRMIPQTLSLPLYPLYSRTAHFSAATLW